MKAAILTELNSPLTIADVKPCALRPGQVLVRVLLSGICGAQLQEIRGEKGNAGFLPHLLGHEGSGIVEDVGAGVSKVKRGDKVVLHWRQGIGMESDLPRYDFNGKVITSGRVTTFSELSICSENRVTKVPTDAPDELCALLGCGLSTALGVMENEAKLKMGESILIVGCGGVGMNLIRVARMMGAAFVVGSDVVKNKSHEAFKAGASQFYDSETDGEDEKFDVIVDTTGHFLASENLAPSGRYIMVGQPPNGAAIQISNAKHLFDGEGKTIKATQGGGFNPTKDIPRYVNAWRSGFLHLDGIVTHTLPLDEINTGIELVKSGGAGRVMIKP